MSLQILQNGDKVHSRPAPPAGVRRILWATPSAADPRPLHSRVQILGIVASGFLAFFGTPSCHLRIFGLFATLGNIAKDTLRSRPEFLLIIVDFVAHGCSLACLVLLLWRPRGAWDDPGTKEGPRKDPVRSRLGFY